MMMMQTAQHQRICSAAQSGPRAAVCASSSVPLQRRRACVQPSHSSSRAPAPAAALCSRRQLRLRVQAEAGEGGASGFPEEIKPEGAPSLLPEGTKVRVKEDITVYHVPKNPQGVKLQGMEGEIEKCVALYTDKQGKSHVLSPNFPYLVKLQIQVDGKDVNFKAHLEEEELEVLQ